MTKGGYQIIDFEGKKQNEEYTIVLDGVYEKVKNTTKAILISGLVWGDTKYRDFFAIERGFDDYNKNYTFNFPPIKDLYFIITPDDEVLASIEI